MDRGGQHDQPAQRARGERRDPPAGGLGHPADAGAFGPAGGGKYDDHRKRREIPRDGRAGAAEAVA
jgi:hypothetical protein